MDEIEVAYLILTGQAFTDENELIGFPDEARSPEKKALSNEAWDKLSGDAKEILELALSTPSKIDGVITPTGRVSKNSPDSVFEYVSGRWGASKALVLFAEIKAYIRSDEFDVRMIPERDNGGDRKVEKTKTEIVRRKRKIGRVL